MDDVKKPGEAGESKDEIIAEQDRMIGELTRKVKYLEDSESRRQDWLRRAKKEAGYEDMTSFDVVWRETLNKARNWDISQGGE